MLNPVETILQAAKRTKNWVKLQIYTDNESTGQIQPSSLLEVDEDVTVQQFRQLKISNIQSKLAIFWTTLTHSRRECT